MAKYISSVWLILLLAFAVLLAGCGGGGGGGAALDNSPFSRDTGPTAQSGDLVGALDHVDAPNNGGITELLDPTTSTEDFLGLMAIPSTIAGYYPLLNDLPSTRFQTGARSPMMAKNELVIAALARALTRGAGRGTEAIDFTGANGVHWVGSYTYTTSGPVVVIGMNVTGSRDTLGINIHLEANSDQSLSGSFSTSTSEFSYSFKVAGSVGTDTINLTASGTGNSDETVSLASSTDNGSMHEETNYLIAVNDRITYRSTTTLDLSYTSPDGIVYDSTLGYSADAWLFAPDGYWIHAVVSVNATPDDYPYTFTATASDGYTLTYDSNTDVGTLTDDSGTLLADLRYSSAEGAIRVDFTLEMEAQGAVDTYIYLYALDT